MEPVLPSALAFSIAPAITPADLDAVRDLFRDYVRAVGTDPTFRGIRSEIESLPGSYAPPAGIIMLSRHVEGRAAGFAAMRPIDLPNTCELKRQYVCPELRGHDLGRRLALAVVERAWLSGYRHVVLDLRASMTSARQLYSELGFRPIRPFNRNPLAGTRYLGLDL